MLLAGAGSVASTISGSSAAIWKDADGAEICSDRVKYTFIAADCGSQPDNIARGTMERSFPQLEHCEWSVTDSSVLYNCIAWSVGETNIHYVDVATSEILPIQKAIDVYWGDADGNLTLEEIDSFYDAKGYIPTTKEAGDYVVVYYSGFHAARKKDCDCGAGRWSMFESKMGILERIEHVEDQINGGAYEVPERYYKKK